MMQCEIVGSLGAAFDAGAAAGGSKAMSIGEVVLQQPLPLIERYSGTRTAAQSVRSMSAETAGALATESYIIRMVWG
jgi:hypothetical protein